MAKRSRSTIGEDPLDALVPYDASAEDAEDVGGDAPEDAEEGAVSQTPEPDDTETSEAATATSRARSKRARGGGVRRAEKQPTSVGPESGAGEQPVTTETARDLERMNKELQVRIRELEFELAGGAREDEGELAEDAGVSEETSSIIAMVKDLHGEIDAAYELKEALEADLAVAKGKLDEERSLRAELEARVKLLEAKAALGDQLREDISFVEEERNETARRLEEATSKLEQITEQRDRLVEQIGC